MKIELGRDAHKALTRRIPRRQAARILARIEELAADPRARHLDVKPLHGRSDLRLRVGEYRVIFKIVGDTLIVTDVGPRGGVFSK